MQYGLTLPNFGQFFDPHVVADLAAEAEDAGWHGFFLWDHMLFDGRPRPIADPWVALAAIAENTSRIRIGTLVTPLARRRPWKLARETVTLDHLSGGRLILGVGLGAPSDVEFGRFGEDPDPVLRGEKLDEGLEVLTGLWSGEPFRFRGRHYRVDELSFEPSPLQTPRIPIWVGGVWPRKRAFRRAARWDGVFPLIRRNGVMFGSPTPGELEAMTAYVRAHRETAGPYDVVVGGEFPRQDPEMGEALVTAFAKAGATWMLEGPGDDQDLVYLRELIPQGPPGA
jgi:alkanesulfonate monooxygenase SsuD/methylene tetrahydromethanopterin reductase-like flavin-dependent oxidoreductase (luciferase family)